MILESYTFNFQLWYRPPMTRMVSLVGVAGLVGAAYLAVHRTSSQLPELDAASSYNVLFAVAIAIVSLLVVVTARNDMHRE